MRESPSVESQVVSQTFLGERVFGLERKNEWFLIETPDQYKGWVLKEMIFERKTPYLTNLKTSRLSTPIYSRANMKYGPLFTVPYQSLLQSVKENESWISVLLPNDEIAYIQQGIIDLEPSLMKKSDLVLIANRFLGIPYIWGGRTSFGYDCSAFIQMLYQKINLSLPRDSKDQILSSSLEEIPISQIAEGDLLFFGKDKNEIAHVGLAIGGDAFIHATASENLPFLRISSLQDLAWSGKEESIYPFRAAYQPRKSI